MISFSDITVNVIDLGEIPLDPHFKEGNCYFRSIDLDTTVIE